MQPPKGDLGYWMGWAVSFGIAGAFLIYIVSQEPVFYDLFCSAADTNCGREWWSAMGGWAAVAAVIPTIYFLSKQISQASSQHRDHLVQRVRDRNRIANNALRQVEAGESYIAAFREQAQGKDTDIALATAIAAFGSIDGVLTNSALAAFEEVFDLPYVSNRLTISRLVEEEVQALQALGKTPGIRSGQFGPRIRSTLNSAKGVIDLLEQYLGQVRSTIFQVGKSTADLDSI